MTTHAARLEATDTYAQPWAMLPGFVGFFFSFRLFLVLLTVRVFQGEAQSGVVLSIGLNLLLLLFVLFHSFGNASWSLPSTLRIPPLRWVAFFLAFSLASMTWTAAVSLSAAMAYWAAMFADVAMVVLLLRTGPEIRMMNAICKGFVVGACTIAAIAWMMPLQSDLRLGDEELLGPNQIGYVCAFAVFLAQFLILRGARQWRIPAIFLAITLLRSLSKTTIVAFLAAELLLLIRDRSVSRKTKIRLAFAGLCVVALFWNLLDAYYVVYTNAGNQAETLTGRLGIWAFILDKAVEQPWIGHGFHSVWKVIPPFGAFEARHAHNELLQQFYAYGAVGVLMLVGLYRSFYTQIKKLPRSSVKTLFLGMLLFAIVRGFADTEVFDLSLPLWAIAMVVLIAVHTQARGEAL